MAVVSRTTWCTPAAAAAGQNGLRRADVARGASPGFGAQVGVDSQVDQRVDAGEPIGQPRVGHITQTPGGRGRPTLGVQAHHPADLPAERQLAGQRLTETGSRSGDRDGGLLVRPVRFRSGEELTEALLWLR